VYNAKGNLLYDNTWYSSYRGEKKIVLVGTMPKPEPKPELKPKAEEEVPPADATAPPADETAPPADETTPPPGDAGPGT
jgi:hypothetical protein